MKLLAAVVTFLSLAACEDEASRQPRTEYIYVEKEVEKIVYRDPAQSNTETGSDDGSVADDGADGNAEAGDDSQDGSSLSDGTADGDNAAGQAYVAGNLALSLDELRFASGAGTAFKRERVKRTRRADAARIEGAGCAVTVKNAITQETIGTTTTNASGRFYLEVPEKDLRTIASVDCGGNKRAAMLTPREAEEGDTTDSILADETAISPVNAGTTVIAAYTMAALLQEVEGVKVAVDALTDPELKQALWDSMLKTIDAIAQKKMEEIQAALDEGVIGLSDNLVAALASGSQSISAAYESAGAKEPAALTASRAADAAFLETMKSCNDSLGGTIKTCTTAIAKVVYGMGFPIMLRVDGTSAALTSEEQCSDAEDSPQLAGFPKRKTEILRYADEFARINKACGDGQHQTNSWQMCENARRRVFGLPGAIKWDGPIGNQGGNMGQPIGINSEIGSLVYCVVRPRVKEIDRNANYFGHRKMGNGQSVEAITFFAEAAADPSAWAVEKSANNKNGALTGLAYAMLKGFRYDIDSVVNMITQAKGGLNAFTKAFWVAGFNTKLIAVRDDSNSWYRTEGMYFSGTTNQFRATLESFRYQALSDQEKQWRQWDRYLRLSDVVGWSPKFDEEGDFTAYWSGIDPTYSWLCDFEFDAAPPWSDCSPQQEVQLGTYASSVAEEFNKPQSIFLGPIRDKMLVFNGLTNAQISNKLDTIRRHDSSGNSTGTAELQVLYKAPRARQRQICEAQDGFQRCYSVWLENGCWDGDVSTPCFSTNTSDGTAEGENIAYDAAAVNVVRGYDSAAKATFYSFVTSTGSFGLTMDGDNPSIVSTGNSWSTQYRIKNLAFPSSTFTASDYFMMAEMQCGMSGCYPSGVYRLMNAVSGAPLLDEDFSPLMLVALTGRCNSDYEMDLYGSSGSCLSVSMANRFVLVKIVEQHWDQDKQREVYKMQRINTGFGGTASLQPFQIPGLDLSKTKLYEINWGSPSPVLQFDSSWGMNFNFLGFTRQSSNQSGGGGSQKILTFSYASGNFSLGDVGPEPDIPAYEDFAPVEGQNGLRPGRKYIMQSQACDVTFPEKGGTRETNCKDSWFLVRWDGGAIGKAKLVCLGDPAWGEKKSLRLPIDIWKNFQPGGSLPFEGDAYFNCEPIPEAKKEQISQLFVTDYGSRMEFKCRDGGCANEEVRLDGPLRSFAIRVEQASGPVPNLGYDARRSPFYIDFDNDNILDDAELPWTIDNEGDIGQNSWRIREIAMRTAPDSDGNPFFPGGWADYGNANSDGFPESCREVEGSNGSYTWYRSKPVEDCPIISDWYTTIRSRIKKNDNSYAFPRKTAVGKLLAAAFQPDASGRLVVDRGNLNALQAFALVFLYRESQSPILFPNVEFYSFDGSSHSTSTMRAEELGWASELPYFNSKIGNMFPAFRLLD